MRLLLDTRPLLWWLFDSPRLGRRARQAIGHPDATVFVSAISAAEIAAQRAAGTLDAPDDLDAQLAANWFVELPVQVRHGLAAVDVAPRGRDPYGRILVAQARCEGLTVVTADPAIEACGVRTLPAG